MMYKVKPFGKRGGYIYLPKELIGSEIEIKTSDNQVMTSDNHEDVWVKLKPRIQFMVDQAIEDARNNR